MAGLDALAVGGGVTDPRDARHATGGLLAVQGPTDLDIRTGVAWGPGTNTVVSGTPDTGQMTVLIGVHHAVTTRGSGNGPYLGPTLDVASKVNIAGAPGSGSRIDVVYVKQQDGNSGVPSPDVATAPLYGVLQGTSSTGSPAKPNLSTIVGAEELATVQVSAGAVSTNDSRVVISNTAKLTVARGARVPVRNQADRDAITPFPGLEVYRLDTGHVELCTQVGPTTWATLFDPATPAPPQEAIAFTASGATLVTGGTAEAVLGFTTFSVPLVTGRAYSAEWEGELGATGGAGLVRAHLRAANGAVPTTASTAVAVAKRYLSGAGGPFQVDATTGRRLFQVGAAGTWFFAVTGAVLSGAATSMSLLPDFRSFQSITVYDEGAATAGLRTI